MNEHMEDWGLQKKRKVWPLVLSTLLVLFLIIGAVLYPFIKGHPKKVFTTFLNTFYEEYKKDLNTLSTSSINGRYDVNFNLVSNDYEENQIFALLKDLDFGLDVSISLTEEKMHFGIDTQYKNKDLLDVTFDTDKEHAYMYLKNIYDKYLEVPLDNSEELYQLKFDVKDYETVLDHLKKAIDEALENKYFKMSKAEIEKNEEKIKVTKNSLVLNEENYNDFIQDIATSLKNDSFIGSLSRITGTSKNNIKAELEKIINSNEKLQNGDLVISILTKGASYNFVGILIEDNKDSISILENDENSLKLEAKIDGEIIKGTITLNDETMDLEIYMNTNELQGSIFLKFTYFKDKEFPNITITPENSIPIESLTEEDGEQILNNLENIPGIDEFIEAFSKLFSDSSSIGM